MIQSSTEQKREPGTDWVYPHIYGTWLSQKCDWRPWSRITVRRSVGLTCCFTVYFYKKLEHLAAVVFLPLLQSIMSAALGGPLWANSPLSGCRKLMHFFHRAVFCQAMNCTCSLGVQQVPQCKVRSVSVHSEGNRASENSLMFVFWNYVLLTFDLPWWKPLGHMHCIVFADLLLNEYEVSSH